MTGTGADAPLRRYLAEGEVTPGENAYDYYSVDQLGSVRDALDATTGASVGHYDYEWYGVPLGMPKASATDFRYAGLFLEQRSGLYLSATRAYDPVVGRWLSRDPIGEAGGVNLYGYVGGEPVGMIDPLGLCGNSTGQSLIGQLIDSIIGFLGDIFGFGPQGGQDGSGAVAGGPGYGVGFGGAGGGGPSGPGSSPGSIGGGDSAGFPGAGPKGGGGGNIHLVARTPTLYCQNVECGAPMGGAFYPLCPSCYFRLLKNPELPPVLLENGQKYRPDEE